MSDSRCRGSKPDGSACGATIIGANGWCAAHDPGRAAARKRASARANQAGRDPELAEIKAVLKTLDEEAQDPGAYSPDIIELRVKVNRARIYACKADSEIKRHAAEVLELEEHAAELEDALEELMKDPARRSSSP